MLCASCHQVIEGPGLVANGHVYCCAGCVYGRSCLCLYSGSSTLYADALALAGSRLTAARPQAGTTPVRSAPAGETRNLMLPARASPNAEANGGNHVIDARERHAVAPSHPEERPQAAPSNLEETDRTVPSSQREQPDAVSPQQENVPLAAPSLRGDTGGLADAFLKEAENVKQAAQKLGEADSRTSALGQILQQVANLLQVAAEQLYRLPDAPVQQTRPAPAPPPYQEVAQGGAKADSGDSPSAKGTREDLTGQTWESVQLTVENVPNRILAFQYASALEQLDSVKEITILRAEGRTLHCQVWITSNPRFTREILGLPDYRPRRVQASSDKITVTLAPIEQEGTIEGQPVETPQHSTRESQTIETAPAGGNTSANVAGVGSLHTSRSPRTGGIVEVGSEAFFNARHYLIIDGTPGPIEMRSWRVEMSLVGDHFDDKGTLVGFDAAEASLKQILAGYNNRMLNDIEPYSELPPTPENIARTLYGQIKAGIANKPLRLKSLKVWATPTQYALYSEPTGAANGSQ